MATLTANVNVTRIYTLHPFCPIYYNFTLGGGLSEYYNITYILRNIWMAPYRAISWISLIIPHTQNAIFIIVGRFWSESQSISFVVRPECVWCLGWVVPLSSVCAGQKGGFVPRLECGAAMRVRPAVVGRASSDIVRRPSSSWPITLPMELKLGKPAQRQVCCTIGPQTAYMPGHHQNQTKTLIVADVWITSRWPRLWVQCNFCDNKS